MSSTPSRNRRRLWANDRRDALWYFSNAPRIDATALALLDRLFRQAALENSRSFARSVECPHFRDGQRRMRGRGIGHATFALLLVLPQHGYRLGLVTRSRLFVPSTKRGMNEPSRI